MKSLFPNQDWTDFVLSEIEANKLDDHNPAGDWGQLTFCSHSEKDLGSWTGLVRFFLVPSLCQSNVWKSLISKWLALLFRLVTGDKPQRLDHLARQSLLKLQPARFKRCLIELPWH
jgi:hypothetical protein